MIITSGESHYLLNHAFFLAMFSLEKMPLASYLLISCMASCLSAFQLMMIHDIKVRLPPNMKIFFTDFYKPHCFQVREAG